VTTALIVCGALAREVVDIARRHGWDAEVFGVAALDHMFPARIAPHVEKRILSLRERYDRLIVVYGDCGSGGALDATLTRYGVERVAGPHCYEMFAGADFQSLMESEPGTFFLTDFLVRAFHGTVVKGLGLDQYPELRDDYFANYRRIVYLAQNPTPDLRQRAAAIAEYLNLPLQIRHTGYGLLETRLAALMNGNSSSK